MHPVRVHFFWLQVFRNCEIRSRPKVFFYLTSLQRLYSVLHGTAPYHKHPPSRTQRENPTSDPPVILPAQSMSNEDLLFQECTEISQLGAEGECSPSSSGDPFVFYAVAARALSESTAFEGTVAAVWMVSGSESWSESNEICRDILQCEAIDERMLDGDNVEVHKRILHRDYRFVSSRCTKDEILLMLCFHTHLTRAKVTVLI